MPRSPFARLARSSDDYRRATAGHPKGRSGSSPRIHASDTWLGLREQYRYEPGPPGRDWTHVHPDIQICFSHDAAGRYRSGQWQIEVPPGAVSIIDAWEPHACEDPVPQKDPSHYDVLYVSKAVWDEAADAPETRRRFGAVVTTNGRVVRSLRRLLRHLDRRETALAIGADFVALVKAITMSAGDGASLHRERSRTTTNADLDRARDLIHARLRTGVTLEEVAAEARLDSTYVVDAFRARFGVPPHRLQTQLRLELAKRRMIAGATIAEAAADAGFADQSHLTRQLRRYMGITPGRYRAS